MFSKDEISNVDAVSGTSLLYHSALTLFGQKRYRNIPNLMVTFESGMAKANFDAKKKVVGCTLSGVVKDLRKGDRILFDDGLFEAVVDVPDDSMATLRITRVSASKPFLKPEKGINFPDTALSVRCLTDYDKSVIPFAQKNADILGFSFVRSAVDVAQLQGLLRQESGKT